MEASEAFNKMVRVRASQLARERGDKVIRLSDLRQVNSIPLPPLSLILTLLFFLLYFVCLFVCLFVCVFVEELK